MECKLSTDPNSPFCALTLVCLGRGGGKTCYLELNDDLRKSGVPCKVKCGTIVDLRQMYCELLTLWWCCCLLR